MKLTALSLLFVAAISRSGVVAAQTLYGNRSPVVYQMSSDTDPSGCRKYSPSSSLFTSIGCGSPYVSVTFDAATETVYTYGTGQRAGIMGFDTDGNFLGSRLVTEFTVASLGFDSNHGILWAADFWNTFAAYDFSVRPSTCTEPATLPIIGPLTIPSGLGNIEGLDWDPFSGTLWMLLDEPVGAETILNVAPDGTLLSSFQLPTGIRPSSLAFDSASPFGGHLYIGRAFAFSGGSTTVVDAYLLDGTPAPDTYAFSSQFRSIGVSDMAFAPHGSPFGLGSGFPPIWLQTFGRPTSPSASFGFRLKNAAPGSVATIALGRAPICPSITILGASLHLDLAQIVAFRTQTVGSSSQVFWNTPIPPGVPVGFELFAQVFARQPGGGFFATNGTVARVSM